MTDFFKLILSNLLVISFILFFNSKTTLSQDIENIDDTCYLDSSFTENLDTVTQTWMIEQLIDTIESPIEKEIFTGSIDDSIFIQRLQNIPSSIPLTYNTIVRRYIEMYLNKRKELLGKLISLSKYYFPIFEDIFDSYNLPTELKYLSIVESALNPVARSKARAVGIWQFIFSTGRKYDLTVNSLVDERCDPIKSTHAAAKFLKDLYNIYNDWLLALAAYNCGPGNVNKAIKRAKNSNNYWDIYFYLPRETRGYVPAYIAVTYIMNYYKEHNIPIYKVNLNFPVDTIIVNNKLHLRQISEVLGIPYEILFEMNPQYRTGLIPASQEKSYSIILPEQYTLKFIEYRDSIMAYKSDVYLKPEILTQSPYLSHSRHNYDNYKKIIYKIKPGDNLGSIAQKYNVRVSDLKYWNNLRSNKIVAGKKLVIYVPDYKAKLINSQKKSTEEITNKISLNKLDVKPDQKLIEAKPDYNLNENEFITYIVKKGDTLWEIAQKFPGVTPSDIMKYNNIDDVKSIKPGQKLLIKVK